MGSVAPIVMSLIVFSGAAQFAALTVLTAGGGVVAAVAAGMLMNGRWLPMGLAVGPFLKGRPVRRSLESHGARGLRRSRSPAAATERTTAGS